ncbi:MAG: BamA/TamA family outer membrane protein, partial [Pseudomonadota bacterium]
LEFSRETDAVEQRDLAIWGVEGNARIDRSNDFLNPTRGWRAALDAGPGLIVGDTSAQFFSATARASHYQPLSSSSRFVLASRVLAGTIVGAETLDLPVSRRFFAGGGGSARGFGFQDIGPVDSDGTPIGGRGLLELSTEIRWRFSDTLGFAFFADSASVTDNIAPSFEDLRLGLGAGIRYFTAIGPLRLDIGTPINPGPDDDPVQVYISIGQAF